MAIAQDRDGILDWRVMKKAFGPMFSVRIITFGQLLLPSCYMRVDDGLAQCHAKSCCCLL